MTQSIRFDKTGGPEVLRAVDVEVGEPGPGQLRVRHTAIGVNFLDVYHRSGLYPQRLPSGVGVEAAGVVEAVGPDVSDIGRGDRIAYAGGPPGAYAEARLLPADRAVKLPRAVSDREGAALLLKGLTAQYLLRRTYPVKPGETLLIHAAAGGVGSILVPWAKHLGASVIGTAGGAEKAERARRLGCDAVVDYRREDFVSEVRKLTGGRGVDVVYDSVGKDTFLGSLDCLRPLGMMVSYGNASGKPAAFDPLLLSDKGSLFLTRPTLFHYVARREDLLLAAKALFHVVRTKVVKAEIGQTYPLAEAARAHADLEARRTVGATLLLP